MISARGNSTAKRDAVSHDVQAEVGHVESQRQPWLRLMSRLTGSSDLPNRGLPNHDTIIQLIGNSLRWLMPPFQTASGLGPLLQNTRLRANTSFSEMRSQAAHIGGYLRCRRSALVTECESHPGPAPNAVAGIVVAVRMYETWPAHPPTASASRA